MPATQDSATGLSRGNDSPWWRIDSTRKCFPYPFRTKWGTYELWNMLKRRGIYQSKTLLSQLPMQVRQSTMNSKELICAHPNCWVCTVEFSTFSFDQQPPPRFLPPQSWHKPTMKLPSVSRDVEWCRGAVFQEMQVQISLGSKELDKWLFR